MDGTMRSDRTRLLPAALTTGVLVIAAWAWKVLVIDGGGISLMSSDSDATGTTSTGTSTESCVLGMVPHAPEDTPVPSDVLLHPNAYAVVVSNQEAIAILKQRLAAPHPCGDEAMIRGHIDLLRGEIARMRSGVVPLRPPYNLD